MNTSDNFTEPRPPRIKAMTDKICIVQEESGKQIDYSLYQHDPLPPGRYIRLLKVQRAKSRWPLSRKLLSRWQSSRQPAVYEYTIVNHELLHQDPAALDVSKSPYVTISYAWGNADFDHPLIMVSNGQQTVLPVTANAWEAVQRTSSSIERDGKLLWIDQICIAQHDDREKEQQVQMIGDVYRQGWHCMIWLGPSSNSTRDAFLLLDQIQPIFSEHSSFFMRDSEVADLSHAQIRQRFMTKFGRDVLPVSTNPGWAAIAELLMRPYYTRTWTFQEAVLCFKGGATIRCGHFSIPAKTFIWAVMLVGNEVTVKGSGVSTRRSALMQISRLQIRVVNDNLIDLTWLLSNNEYRDCTDPRDRIYAFLALRKEDGPTNPIQIKYDKSPEQLYTEVARSIIQSQSSLRFCIEAQERYDRPGEMILTTPSWVPNWTRKHVAHPYESVDINDAFFKADASRLHLDDDSNSSILRTQGKRVDTIKEILDLRLHGPPYEARLQTLVEEVLPTLLIIIRSIAPHASESAIAHLIVQTITLGGYTRANLGTSDLDHPEAWSAATCQQMITYFLNRDALSQTQLPISPEMWLHALTRDAYYCTNRLFAVLEHNILALVPLETEPDDLIVILHGSTLPFVLRPAMDGYYTMIGICYVDKIMLGQAVTWTEDEADTFLIC